MVVLQVLLSLTAKATTQSGMVSTSHSKFCRHLNINIDGELLLRPLMSYDELEKTSLPVNLTLMKPHRV